MKNLYQVETHKGSYASLVYNRYHVVATTVYEAAKKAEALIKQGMRDDSVAREEGESIRAINFVHVIDA
jgi:hypothetical protein